MKALAGEPVQIGVLPFFGSRRRVSLSLERADRIRPNVQEPRTRQRVLYLIETLDHRCGIFVLRHDLFAPYAAWSASSSIPNFA